MSSVDDGRVLTDECVRCACAASGGTLHFSYFESDSVQSMLTMDHGSWYIHGCGCFNASSQRKNRNREAQASA